MKFTTLALAAIATIVTVQANPTGRVITGPNDSKLPFKSDKWVETPEGKWSLDAKHVPDFDCRKPHSGHRAQGQEKKFNIKINMKLSILPIALATLVTFTIVQANPINSTVAFKDVVIPDDASVDPWDFCSDFCVKEGCYCYNLRVCRCV
ncbi:hypothetical protein HDU97_007975 [Phlyctochytrium planicorne]|nr:hypothetical protein HDU97_007975 [Phlyctochytrium planicorne]